MQYHLPAFPEHIFPESLQKYIRNVAEAMVCPVDFVGAMVLAVLSSAIGTSRCVKVKEGWREPPVVYIAIVAPPSSKKSPVFKEALRPVYQRQEEFRGTYQKAAQAYEYELEVWEEEKRKDRGPRPTKPRMQRLLMSDITFEAVARLLAENERGLLLTVDELAAWINSMDQYRKGKGADREHWLSLWTCSLITVDRASKEEPIIIPNPFVSVVGGIQPDRLKVFKSKEHDGFIDRILFVFPPEVPNRWSDDIVSPLLREAYQALYEALHDLQPTQGTNGQLQPLALPFSATAREAFKKVLHLNNQDINHEGNPLLKSTFGKLEAYFFRFALILQLSHDPQSHQIEETAVQGAMLLLEYFKSHVRKVYATLENKEVDDLLIKAIHAIRTNGGSITARDFYTNKVAGITKSEKVKQYFEMLEKRGYGKLHIQTNSGGGRPTVSFHLKDFDCPICNQQSAHCRA